MPGPQLTTRSATPGDVDAVLAFWERAAENEHWARWIKPLGRRTSGA